MRNYNCQHYIKCLEELPHFDSETCDQCDREKMETQMPTEKPPKKHRGWPKGKKRPFAPRKKRIPPQEPEPPNPDPGRPEPGPPIPTKICKQCKNPFPATEEYFHKHRRGKYGLDARCKGCKNKVHRDLAEERKGLAERYQEDQSKPLFAKATTEELVDALQKSAGMAIAQEVVTQLREKARALNAYADNLEARYLKE